MKKAAFVALGSVLVLVGLAQAASGASGCASRRVVAPEQTIVGVLFDLGVGGAESLLADAGRVDFPSAPGRIRQLAETVQVQIDGRPASGWCGWLQAAARIAGYALDRTDRGQVDVRRADRHYTIQDGQVTVRVERTVIERGPLGRRIPVRVAVTITATETASGVVFLGQASGTKDGCLGARAISSGLAQALGQIEATGRRFYFAGRGADIGDMADQVFSAFEVH